MDTIKNKKLLLGACGVLLVICSAMLSYLSPQFAYENPLAKMPVKTIVALLMMSGCLYLIAALFVRRMSGNRLLLGFILIIGFALRLSQFFSTPVLEDDYYRFFWDGAVVAHGYNPYAYAPADVLKHLNDDKKTGALPRGMMKLAKQSRPVLERVNHPDVRSVYPPVLQSVFALSYSLSPYSLFVWRIILLLFDMAMLVLLWTLLQHLSLPHLFLTVYWWNPLLVKEIYNSGHIEVIVLAFVAGAVLLTIRKKHVLASVLLALACGTKLWPVMLLPLFLRPVLHDKKQFFMSAGIFFILVFAMALPVVFTGLDAHSGFTAYGKQWEMNDALFVLILRAFDAILSVFGFAQESAEALSRLFVAGALALYALWLSLKPYKDSLDFYRRCLYAVAALFLLSPAQFPWYYLWVLPFLVFQPRPSLLLLTALLPLYYLRFYFKEQNNVDFFDDRLVWFEYAPVGCLLLYEAVTARWKKEEICGREALAGALTK